MTGRECAWSSAWMWTTDTRGIISMRRKEIPGLPAANHSDISGNLKEPTSVRPRPRPGTRLRVCVRAAQGLYRSSDHHFQTDTRTDRHTDTETAKVCERSERERQRVRVLEREWESE